MELEIGDKVKLTRKADKEHRVSRKVVTGVVVHFIPRAHDVEVFVEDKNGERWKFLDTGDADALYGPGNVYWKVEGMPQKKNNPSKPLLVIHASTKNDTNGNPRRVFVVLDKSADIVETIDEEYMGTGALRAGGYDKLPRFNIETTPGEYKALKKIGRKSNPEQKLSPKVAEKILANRSFKEWAKKDPVLGTAAGAGLGALAGAMGGYLVGAPAMGSVVGGALGGYAAAPDDRKGRAAVGGGVGGLFTPVGAVAGGAIAGRKPNPTRALKNKLLK